MYVYIFIFTFYTYLQSIKFRMTLEREHTFIIYHVMYLINLLQFYIKYRSNKPFTNVN